MQQSLRTIQHPDVQINEIAISNTTDYVSNSNVFVAGYSSDGKNYEPQTFLSVTDYELICGKPKNEAEFYSYTAIKNVIDNEGTVIFSKIPYDNDASTKYYSVGVSFENFNTPTSAQVFTDRGLTGHLEFVQTCTKIDDTLYQSLSSGTPLSSTILSGNQITVVLKNKNFFTYDDGIFVTVTSLYDSLLSNGALAIDYTNACVEKIYNSETIISDQALSNITFTSENTQNSLSRQLALLFPITQFKNNVFDSSKNSFLSLSVCRISKSSNDNTKYAIVVEENFVGSIDSTKIDEVGNSLYLPDVINRSSNYLKAFGSGNSDTEIQKIILENDQNFIKSSHANRNVLIPCFNKSDYNDYIDGTTLATKLNTCFSYVSGLCEYDIDTVLEAGLGTIAQYSYINNGIYDSSQVNDTITGFGDISLYQNVQSVIGNFCKSTRKDCVCILDAYKSVTMNAGMKKIRKGTLHTFSNSIKPYLKYLTTMENNYAILYLPWIQKYNTFTATNYWIPCSVEAIKAYCYVDKYLNAWEAPAGLNNGVIGDIVDISFNPNPNDCDVIYNCSINYMRHNLSEGTFTLEGQRTLLYKDVSLNRLNARRVMISLEKQARTILRGYLGQPNNYSIRQEITSRMKFILDGVKNHGGIYDYNITCDSTNNTQQVVNNQELRIMFIVKPVKLAEFIIIDITESGSSSGAKYELDESIKNNKFYFNDGSLANDDLFIWRNVPNTWQFEPRQWG